LSSSLYLFWIWFSIFLISLTLTHWALSLMILFYFVISILYIELQVSRVNLGWLGFFKLLFYFILALAVKLLTFEHFSFFHFHLCELSWVLGGQVNTWCLIVFIIFFCLTLVFSFSRYFFKNIFLDLDLILHLTGL
jgi:hypothetical protein